MRVIAGKYKSRKLITPRNNTIRPTSDKIRGSIFNTLKSKGVLHNAIVLDLFCGTGALGIEALSRGASHCTFVDQNRQSLSLTQKNVQAMNAEHQSIFIRKDAQKIDTSDCQAGEITLAFLDPPYGQDLVDKALWTLHEQTLLHNDSLCVIETKKDCHLTLPDIFEIIDQRVYGQTCIVYACYTKPFE